MTLSIYVRPYTRSDAAAVAATFFDAVRHGGLKAYSELQVAAWAPAPPSEAAIDSRTNDGRMTLVAVNSDGVVVGYGDLLPEGHIDHLYCRPELMGQGVGSALLDALLDIAQSLGLKRVNVEASEIAVPTFLRRGFTILERRDFAIRGVPIHNFCMEWKFETSSEGG